MCVRACVCVCERERERERERGVSIRGPSPHALPHTLPHAPPHTPHTLPHALLHAPRILYCIFTTHHTDFTDFTASLLFLDFFNYPLFFSRRAPGWDRLYSGEAKRDAGVLTKLN